MQGKPPGHLPFSHLRPSAKSADKTRLAFAPFAPLREIVPKEEGAKWAKGTKILRG